MAASNLLASPNGPVDPLDIFSPLPLVQTGGVIGKKNPGPQTPLKAKNYRVEVVSWHSLPLPHCLPPPFG